MTDESSRSFATSTSVKGSAQSGILVVVNETLAEVIGEFAVHFPHLFRQ